MNKYALVYFDVLTKTAVHWAKDLTKDIMGGQYDPDEEQKGQNAGNTLMGIAGATLAPLPVSIASQNYVKKVILSGEWLPVDNEDRVGTKALDGLMQRAKSNGISVGDTEEAVKRMPENNFFQKFQKNQVSRMGAHGPAFAIPSANSIILNLKNPSLLAHELGHAEGNKFLHGPGPRMLGSIGGVASSTGILFDKDQDSARNMAIGGTLSHTPTLLSELVASVKGGKILRSHGLSGRGAFLGLPTYLAAASIPYATYLGKKMFGGFNHNTPAQ